MIDRDDPREDVALDPDEFEDDTFDEGAWAVGIPDPDTLPLFPQSDPQSPSRGNDDAS